jgi:hypothetical protein
VKNTETLMENLANEPVKNQEETIEKNETEPIIQETLESPEIKENEEDLNLQVINNNQIDEETPTMETSTNIENEIISNVQETSAIPEINSTEGDMDLQVINSNEVVVEETISETSTTEETEVKASIEETPAIPEIKSVEEVIEPNLIKEEIPTLTIENSLVSEKSDNHDVEDIDIHEEELDINELEEKYNHLSKTELIELLNSLVQEENINNVKGKVALIKVAYLKIIREEKHQTYLKFIEEGGVKEEYVHAEDETEIQFRTAFDIYRERKNKFNDEQEKLKQDNLVQKQHIIENLKLLINSEETLKKTYDDFKILQDKWKEIGQVPRTENNNLWQNYHFLVEKFFDKVKINKELKDLDLKKNMEAKMILCEKAEELLIEPSILISFKKLQEYHDEWKSIGPVPQDKKDDIWDRFKTASDQINQRRHEFYESQHEQMESNLLAKNALCDKAEQIIATEYNTVKDWQDASNQITELLKIWKTVGHAPRKQNDEVWARFKTYLDAFYAVKSEYFNKVKDEQTNNLNLKIELCLQAESIKERNDWKNATTELLNLQKRWKEIGPVHRRNQDKIWKRFRAACDEFFSKKEAFFSTINENEGSNLLLKEALIEKARNFQFGEDRNENLQNLKDFQREWSEIGHIPMKDKDRLHNEFRSIINGYFDKLRVNSMEASAMNYRNKIENLKENGDAKQILYKEKSFISNKISKIKEDINLWENNIGFLAHSKQADILKNEFAKKIENAKQEVILLEAKFKMLMNS